MGRGVEAVGEATVEGPLHEPGGGPDEQDEPKARPAHPRWEIERRAPGDPPCCGELRRHGRGDDPGDAPHVCGLKRVIVVGPDVPEERVVHKLDDEDHAQHDQGRSGMGQKQWHKAARTRALNVPTCNVETLSREVAKSDCRRSLNS